MSLSIYQIKKITKADYLCTANKKAVVEHLLIDSRKLSFPSTTLFFAFKGQRHDGHKYIADLYEKGLRNFIVSEKIEIQPFADATILLVEDMLSALQAIARFHRKQFDIPVIGITGSNGKTIVKEWLFQLMHEEYYLVRSPKSYNSQVGVSLSLWLIQKVHQLAIIEAGISTRDEMARLAKMIQPTIGLFTNIGAAHSEGFNNIEEKIEEKLKLFETCETIIYCKDDERVHRAMKTRKGKYLFTWSKKKKADLAITKISKKKNQKNVH